MSQESLTQRPSIDDGTNFVVFVNLPARAWHTDDVFHHVYGVRLNDGAKPWPFFRNAETKEWWSLSSPFRYPLDALVWMIDLNQLGYRPAAEASTFLEDVLQELEERAARFGATIAAESTVTEALDKIVHVRKLRRVWEYQATIVVAAPQGAFLVDEWWDALEGVGFERGDGDLFWMYNRSTRSDRSEPPELFCAEPYSQPGYFHHLDRGTDVSFPDVALRFRVRDWADPIAQLRRMTQVAEQLRTKLRAVMLTDNGQPFELEAAEMRVSRALEEMRALQV